MVVVVQKQILLVQNIKKIVRAAIKDLRESLIQKNQTSWFDEMKTLRRATTTATYGELHTRGDWGQTE